VDLAKEDCLLEAGNFYTEKSVRGGRAGGGEILGRAEKGAILSDKK